MFENLTHENCWFQPDCKDKINGFCEEPICLRFEHMKDAFAQSGLSEQQQKPYPINFDTNDFGLYEQLNKERTSMGSWLEKYNSLYLWSHNYLNGKTVWAIKFIQYYIYSTSKAAYLEFPRAYYCTFKDILNLYQIQYDNNRREEFKEMEYKLINSEILAIDDIDFAKSNFKVQQFIGEIINERYAKLKPTIFTSHLSPEEFKEQCDNKFFTSRVIDLSRHYEFTAPSYTEGGELGNGQ